MKQKEEESLIENIHYRPNDREDRLGNSTTAPSWKRGQKTEKDQKPKVANQEKVLG